MSERRFIIRKYVMADSAKQAIERESDRPVDEVYLDDKQPDGGSAHAVGFKQELDPLWRSDEVRAKR